jgi:ribosomal protein S27AE
MDKNMKCPNCGSPMKFSIEADFQIGTSNDLELTLNLPKVEKKILPLNLHVCPKCGSVQFFAPEEIQNSLLRIAENRSSQ